MYINIYIIKKKKKRHNTTLVSLAVRLLLYKKKTTCQHASEMFLFFFPVIWGFVSASKAHTQRTLFSHFTLQTDIRVQWQ